MKHAYGGRRGTGVGTRGPESSVTGKMWRDVPGKLRSPVREKVAPIVSRRAALGNHQREIEGGKLQV